MIQGSLNAPLSKMPHIQGRYGARIFQKKGQMWGILRSSSDQYKEKPRPVKGAVQAHVRTDQKKKICPGDLSRCRIIYTKMPRQTRVGKHI